MKKAFGTCLVVLLVSTVSPLVLAQSIAEQKKVVAFLFGNCHPLNADKTPMRDAQGHALEVEMPLGTGFFVFYPETRGGPNFAFLYLVTAKHVLRDFDQRFLPKIKVRLSLITPTVDKGFDFVEDVAVTDKDGNLLWLHDEEDSADETVVLPFLPDQKKFDFKAISVADFVTDPELKSDAVEEGDNIYFIGLMTQYFGATRNYPVVRRGTLALMTDEKIPTLTGPQRLFLAELQSWPGNSGSPVFLSLGGFRKGSFALGQSLKLLGIMLGGFLNKAVASVVGSPATITWGNELPTGISFIIPATTIRGVLDSQKGKSSRDAEIKRLPAAKP